MSLLTYYYFYFSSIYTGFSWVIQVAVFLVMLLLILSISSIIRFFFVRRVQLQRIRRENKVMRDWQKPLSTVLYFTYQNITIEQLAEDPQIKRPRKKWQQEMVTNLMSQLKKDQSFEHVGGIFNNHNYLVLMHHLGLLSYWEEKMTSGNATDVIKALGILNAIGEGISGSVISQSAYSRKSYLRKYARSTFARFDLHDPFKFLEKGFDKDFNKFDEIRIHYMLSEIVKDRPLPELARWIKNANNDEYKRFLVKEIGYFGQVDSAPYLIELFNSSLSDSLRCEVAETLGALNYAPAVEVYDVEFKFASQNLQLSILNGIGRLDPEICLPFLKEAFHYTQFSEAKIRITSIIRQFEEKGQPVLAELLGTAHSDFERKIFAYSTH